MAVHSSGAGSGWLEDLDIDRPHGLDYVEFNDLRIGINTRMSKEHVAFADTTAGGEHVPGGCAVLDLVDVTTDISSTDGTWIGKGILYDQTRNVLCCFTGDGTDDAGDDIYELMWGPKSICLGADYTWDGAHLFDASCDFSDVAITGDLTIAGKFAIDGSADFSDVFVEGDITIAGKLVIDGSADFSDAYIEGDASIKGVLKVDGTATEFGGTEGVALFYDPTVLTGGNASIGTVTLANGFILKWGHLARTGANTTVTFADPFPTACFQAIACSGVNADAGVDVSTHTIAKASFEIRSHATSSALRWFAIGR